MKTDMNIKINYTNADETLNKIKEVMEGIEKVKCSIKELSQMGVQLELSYSEDNGIELNT